MLLVLLRDPVADQGAGDLENDKGGQGRVAQGGDHADGLHAQLGAHGGFLRAIALAAENADGGAGEYGGQQGAERPADAVHREDVQGVVDLQRALDVVGGEEADEAGSDADDERACRADEARRRGDGAEARHHAGDGAESARLAEPDPFANHPSEGPGGGRQVGDQHGHGGIAVGRQRTAAVESEPADPEHARAGHGEGHVVRRHGLGGKAAPVAQHHGRHDGGGAGGDVNHGAAGEVHQAHLAEPAAAPHPVADGGVHQQHPEGAEHQHR